MPCQHDVVEPERARARSARSSPACVDPHRRQLYRDDPPHACAGAHLERLPLFVWAMYATSIIFYPGTPVIAITLLLMMIERAFHIGSLRPGAGRRSDPLPAPCSGSTRTRYIMILPSMGVISEIITRFCATASSATRSSRRRASRLALIGFLVWGHPHVRVRPVGEREPGRSSSLLSFFVAIPSAIKVSTGRRRCTRVGRSIAGADGRAGFIGLFTTGGLTGPLPADAGDRRPPARHVLRGRRTPPSWSAAR